MKKSNNFVTLKSILLVNYQWFSWPYTLPLIIKYISSHISSTIISKNEFSNSIQERSTNRFWTVGKNRCKIETEKTPKISYLSHCYRWIFDIKWLIKCTAEIISAKRNGFDDFLKNKKKNNWDLQS